MIPVFKPTTITDGEFSGWHCWAMDNYENSTVGPFFHNVDDQGPVSAFRVEAKHLNGGDAVHGGALMSFADSSLFTIASPELEDGYYGVTVGFNCEFLAAAFEGQLMESRGDIMRAGRSLVFIRGIVTADGKPCLNFSGTIKKVPPKKHPNAVKPS